MDFGEDKRVTRPLIPNQYAIHRAKDIKIDGRLNDWGPETQLPGWMLGSTRGRLRRHGPSGLGQGRHLRRGRRARLQVAGQRPHELLGRGCPGTVPRHGRQQGAPRAAAGDHHFWFVPLPDANRVYLGRWKMQSEIPATRYDIPIQGVATRTADGYGMEFLLPAAQIQNYHPEVGSRLGLNLNLTIQGKQANREAYWPSPKKSGVTTIRIAGARPCWWTRYLRPPNHRCEELVASGKRIIRRHQRIRALVGRRGG